MRKAGRGVHFARGAWCAVIERAVLRLTPAELDAFRTWFAGFDSAAWDRQLEEDVAAGSLEALADEAIEDFRAGRCTDR